MDVTFLSQEYIRKNFIPIVNTSQLCDGTLGTSEKVICRTCPQEQAIESCLGHMGYITLRREIPHPLMAQKIYIKLMRFCWLCKRPAKSTLDILTDEQLSENKETVVKTYKPFCSYCSKPLKNMNIRWKSQDFCFEGTTSGGE